MISAYPRRMAHTTIVRRSKKPRTKKPSSSSSSGRRPISLERLAAWIGLQVAHFEQTLAYLYHQARESFGASKRRVDQAIELAIDSGKVAYTLIGGERGFQTQQKIYPGLRREGR